MGVVRSWESRQAELESFCRRLVADTTTIHRRKDLEPQPKNNLFGDYDEEEERNTLVCVTSGVSYLGLALVNKLLQKGYSVRITIENPEDIEKVREMKESREGNGKLEVVMGKLSDVDSLLNAFEGCHGVFHTSAFTDPAGLSGYTKSMAEIEARVSENVMEACARTTTIKRCVFTSSLLACVWQQQNPESQDAPITINHTSWTNESLCKEKKLWYALGKVRAEKAAWRIANERGLKLTTICPALITGPDFCRSNPTSTIAYLKGAQEMYCHGLIATVDVTKLAEAHAIVFKAMNSTASGRYICFDKLIDNQTEAEILAKEIGMPKHKICGDSSSINCSSLHRFMKISNDKLNRLMSGPIRCYNQHYC
ncbi:hypothetical protein HN51_071166 [Arachis hypogaea]|uniref:3-beta hydroxysteroid dehydrogenase/isomerase domain-containing protein n=1 Tax=Arachis hypogaea TaxID=3818 RepID=A0A444YZ85_ARAHY|nr:cinnamoyl-CoA reductase-like SNL6 [Arachis hypogaea]QHO13721.1 uncharacterized protein DS421_15g517930 [Arachis hypogaea]RYR07226.1 hypothetical protein Ahy_B05g074539 isoform A [Arachis hypogaea]